MQTGKWLRRKRKLKASSRDAGTGRDGSLGDRVSLHTKLGIFFFWVLRPIDWLKLQKQIIWCELRESKGCWERSQGSRTNEGKRHVERERGFSGP